MFTYIFISITILVLILILKPDNKPKSELNKNSEDYVPTSELIRRTEERIASSKALIAEIRAKEGNETILENAESETGNYEEYELTGVHIPNRKNYVLNYCNEYDELELKHEKNNKYSDKAIVVKHNGKKIGYIAEYDVEEVHEIIKNPFTSHIAEIEYDGSYLTVRIALEI
jgi:hypothetical protein